MAKKQVPLTYEQRVERELENFQQQTEERYKIAQRAYDYQDAETQRALDAMQERIISISRGLIVVRPEGEKRKVALTIKSEHVTMNALYLATEILKDLALLDIRVEGYKFVPGVCAECGEQIKPAKKKRKVKS